MTTRLVPTLIGALALSGFALSACGQRSDDTEVRTAIAEMERLSDSPVDGSVKLTEFVNIDGPQVVSDEEREVEVRALFSGLPQGEFQVVLRGDGDCAAKKGQTTTLGTIDADDSGKAELDETVAAVHLGDDEGTAVGRAIAIAPKGADASATDNYIACGLVLR